MRTIKQRHSKTYRQNFGCAACGIRNHMGVNFAVIKLADITNFEGNESQCSASKNELDLVWRYTVTCYLLKSDGDVLVNGTINTKSECLLTGKDIYL